jgi:catechol 2,3-dioxygenase-like lactoylglutathione lyase family enzyme
MFGLTRSFSSFAVNDVTEAQNFYREGLGLDVSAATPDPTGPVWLHVGGERGILVYPKADHVAASFTVLNLSVDDIDRAVDELLARGIEIERHEGYAADQKGVYRGGGHSIAWFRDPAGNGLCVVEEHEPAV